MNDNIIKNIVVLKDLPSNIVDEAIIILKPNRKIKSLETINNKTIKKLRDEKDNKYILKEAELLIKEYISKTDNTEFNNKKIEEKYKRLKKYSWFSSSILIMSIILHFL